MIDIISSAVRLGSLLHEDQEINIIAEFFSQLDNEKNNPVVSEYFTLLTSRFSQYGLKAFNVVDEMLKHNMKSNHDIAKKISTDIKSYVDNKSDYKKILILSKKYGDLIDEYIMKLLKNVNDYPEINIHNPSLKIQQCSNELSTAILRSGVLSWISNPSKIKMLKNNSFFIGEYEENVNKIQNPFPYNKKIISLINSLPSDHRSIAYNLENIKFVQYLVRTSIIQGFFFELFEIPESNIIKKKELHKDMSIHPIIIKSDLIFPSNHLFIFRCIYGNDVFYVLTKHMEFRFVQNEGISTTLYGYRYPTNEYSLFRMD